MISGFVDFEWDEKKAAVNFRKHGVPFPFATGVFLDENRLEWKDDRGTFGEQRWITVGLVDGIEITVAFTIRGRVTRLISARKAERHEREDYYENR